MDNREEILLREIVETRKQIELTNLTYRQKDLKRHLEKLKRDLRTYRKLRYGTN